MLSDSCDGEEDGGSNEINGPVPVDEFGQFVADKHANGNKKFRDDYQVCLRPRPHPSRTHACTHTRTDN